MVYVVTADQRGSRRGPDRVATVLDLLAGFEALRPFERTAGDEVQGVLDDARTALAVVLSLVRDGHWSVGLGIGPVREPLPAETRAGTGEAFLLAREAVERAKQRPEHVALGASGPRAADADALLRLQAALVATRSPAGHEVADLLASGLTQSDAAARLGITPQAVSQRVRASWWHHQERTTPLLLELLTDLDAGSVGAGRYGETGEPNGAEGGDA